MSFIRKIKKGPYVYLAEVENHRVQGKVVQKVLRYVGKEVNGQIQRRVVTTDVEVEAVRHCADVLAVHRVAERLGLREMFGEHGPYILSFVYSHLLERPSIRKLEEWFGGTEIPELLGLQEISTGRPYETLGHLSRLDFGRIEDQILERLRRYESKNHSAIIDVTDTYFEGGSLTERSRRGKDGKVSKLLQIGLGVTQAHGFPILMRTYPGTTSNIMIFKDLYNRLLERGYRAVILDRGMSCEDNIRRILEAKMKIIAGVRKDDGLRRRFLARINREALYRREHRVALQSAGVYVQAFPYLGGELIVVYNPSLEVVRRELAYGTEKMREKDFRDEGYSLLYHNTDQTIEAVTRQYFEKEIVDRAFKKLKGVLSLRPIRVWQKEHIEGHVRVCYLAYAILSALEYHLRKSEYSAVAFLEKLRRGYRVHLKDRKSGHRWNTDVLLEKKLYKYFDSLQASA
ncbi:MAG: transposase [Clostridiales bacterium]|nr:transposase [Clostridiales bacterium]